MASAPPKTFLSICRRHGGPRIGPVPMPRSRSELRPLRRWGATTTQVANNIEMLRCARGLNRAISQNAGSRYNPDLAALDGHYTTMTLLCFHFGAGDTPRRQSTGLRSHCSFFFCSHSLCMATREKFSLPSRPSPGEVMGVLPANSLHTRADMLPC